MKWIGYAAQAAMLCGLLSLGGCIGNSDADCTAGGDVCVCRGIGNCARECPEGGCSFLCDGIGNCNLTCEGGGCDVSCAMACDGTGNCICESGCESTDPPDAG